MSFSYAAGGRGGGGFRRSTHQSGGDGPGGGGRRVGGLPKEVSAAKPKRRVACRAEIDVPVTQRALIIGRGGATIGELQRRTGARVNVPGRDMPVHQTVRVEAENVESVLHLCLELTEIGIGREEPVECKVTMLGASVALALQPRPSGEILAGSGFSAFCLSSCCSRDELNVLVDNERFAHPEMSAACLVRPNNKDDGLIVFIYGHDVESKAMFDGLVKATSEAEANKQSCLKDARATALMR